MTDDNKEYKAQMKAIIKKAMSLKVCMDFSDGVAEVVCRTVFGDKPLYLSDMEEKLTLLEAVVKNKADAGVLFSKDGSEIYFVDNKGRNVSGDLILNLLAFSLIENEGEKVILEEGSLKICSDYIKLLGALPLECPKEDVGRKLCEENALFGGGKSGRYYFRENEAESSVTMSAVQVLYAIALLKRDKIRFSDFLDEFTDCKPLADLDSFIE